LTVREALPADAWEIVYVYVDTRRDAYAGILPDHVLLRMSTDREKGSWNGALLRDEEIFVSADPSDRIVGFGSCAPNRLRQRDGGGKAYILYFALRVRAWAGIAVDHALSACGPGHETAVVLVLR